MTSTMPPVAEVYDDYFVVCPHCRHRHGDADEFFGSKDFAEIECDGEGCGRTFVAERQVSVTYMTAPLGPSPGEIADAVDRVFARDALTRPHDLDDPIVVDVEEPKPKP